MLRLPSPLHTLLLLLLTTTMVHAEVPLQVTIEGIEGESLENVRLLLSIEQQKGDELLLEGRIHRLHQKAPEEIRRALEPFGYYRVTIDASLQQEEGMWHARYRIDSGEPVRIAWAEVTLDGEAASDPPFTELLQGTTLRKGAPFIHADYEGLKRELQHLAEERGYFEAQFTQHQARIDLATYQATVKLHFASGPRYRFGELQFSGEHPFEEPFLHRYPDFAPGESYDHARVATLQRTLIASDYFETVELQVERSPNTERQVPITVRLKQRPRNRYQFGIGYGSDSGVRGRVAHDRRWLNEKGDRLSSELQLSEVSRSIAMQHTMPLSRPASDRLVNRAEYLLDTGGDVDSRRILLGSAIDRARGAWRNQWGISYQREDYDIGLQHDESTLFIANVGLSQLRGVDLLNLLRGLRLGLELRGASRQVVSDTDFLQARLDAKSIVPLGKGRILLRGEAVGTQVETIELLPPSLRQFAGGDNSIRGFAYRAIGPTDVAGNVVGGKHLLVGSIEYDHPLSAKWRAALFLDGGNAFNGEFVEAEKGAGIGIRRVLPIGLLRVDLAQALTDPDRPWRLHLTMGLEL